MSMSWYSYNALGAAGDPIVTSPVTTPTPTPTPGVDLSIISASIGQQIFSLTAGIAGGLAGFVLAFKLREAKTLKSSEVLMASLAAAAGAFGAVFIMRHYT